MSVSRYKRRSTTNLSFTTRSSTYIYTAPYVRRRRRRLRLRKTSDPDASRPPTWKATTTFFFFFSLSHSTFRERNALGGGCVVIILLWRWINLTANIVSFCSWNLFNQPTALRLWKKTRNTLYIIHPTTSTADEQPYIIFPYANSLTLFPSSFFFPRVSFIRVVPSLFWIISTLRNQNIYFLTTPSALVLFFSVQTTARSISLG